MLGWLSRCLRNKGDADSLQLSLQALQVPDGKALRAERDGQVSMIGIKFQLNGAIGLIAIDQCNVQSAIARVDELRRVAVGGDSHCKTLGGGHD